MILIRSYQKIGERIIDVMRNGKPPLRKINLGDIDKLHGYFTIIPTLDPDVEFNIATTMILNNLIINKK